MYQLWYYVTVPGTGFETPRIRREIGYRRGRAASDRVTPFLTVDYSVGMQLDDELILRGSVDEAWNYTVRPLANRSHSHRSVIIIVT